MTIRPPLHFTTLACLVLLAACDANLPASPDSAQDTQGAKIEANEPLGFVARFEAPHPLARAQALEAAGHCEEAARLARETIAASGDLSGLCFDRFTLGGAEIVLTACEPPADVDRFQQTWLERLRAMEGVAYADPNATAQAVECVS